jgi:hypothetical protein
MPEEKDTLIDPKGKIFIGYRRACSFWQAYTVYYFLRWKKRLVFKDIENSKRGYWRPSFDDLIRSSEHFILILDPSTFENPQSGDEVIQEIKVALRPPKRNIVQIWFNGFKLDTHGKNLPKNIYEELSNTNAWKIHQEYSISITSDLKEIEDQALFHLDIPETPVPIETQKELLTEVAQTVLSKKVTLTEEDMKKSLSDSDDFQSIGNFIGVSEDEHEAWYATFREDLLEGKIDLTKDDLDKIFHNSWVSDIEQRYSDTDDF